MFSKNILLKRLFLPLFATLGFVSHDGGAAEPLQLVFDRRIPQLRFACNDLAKALGETGYEISVHMPNRAPEAAPGQKVIVLSVDRKAESVDTGYLVSSDGSRLQLTGADARETMYGALDLADSARAGVDIFAPGERHHRPYLERRGIKFNIPLDVRTPSYDDSGDAAQRNIAEMWNFEFWEAFIDQMARDRYNVLTLWNPHPFPSMIQSEAYPDIALKDVCVTRAIPNGRENEWGEPQLVSENVVADLRIVKTMTMERKIAFWRKVMRHARDRGVDVYFITWNICLNAAARPVPPYYRTYANSIPNEQPGKYGITHDVHNPATIAYLRDAVKTFILTYPDLKGIGVTAGEHFPHGDHFDREEWLWETYGRGVLDAKAEQPNRAIEFIHRFWNTGFDNIMKHWADYPDPFAFSFKYARARLYSSPEIPFADDHIRNLKPQGLKSWWNLRNDDIFIHRWGDPDYVRAFLKNFDLDVTAGYYVGSDGYVWGREFVSRHSHSPRELEISKHWFAFMLWGRLGYNPDLDRDYFLARIKEHFPEADPAAVLDTWQTASKIIPLVNRFYWRNWDHMWSVENSQSHVEGYLGIEAFARGETMQESGLLSVGAYVGTVTKKDTATGTTPLEVADQLDALAEASLSGADGISEPGYDLGRTLDDIRGMAYLGQYYADKIRAAVSFALYQATGDETHHQAAVAHAQASYEHCTRYTDHSQARYYSQMLARTGRFDWSVMLMEARADVARMRAATAGK